jgi:hypothetical protein
MDLIPVAQKLNNESYIFKVFIFLHVLWGLGALGSLILPIYYLTLAPETFLFFVIMK